MYHLLSPNDSLDIKGNRKIFLKFHAMGVQFLNDFQENQLLPTVFRNLGVPIESLFTIDSVVGLPYSLSFSMDNDNLTMWRIYANNGRGIALGFDESSLAEGLEKEEVDYLGACEYTTAESLEKEIIKNELFLEYQNNPTILNPLVGLYSQSLKYKHVSFRDENEFRIAFRRHLDECYMAKNDKITTYQIINIPLTALRQIVIGPCLDYRNTKFLISRMLFNHLNGWTEHWKLLITSMCKSNAPYVS